MRFQERSIPLHPITSATWLKIAIFRIILLRKSRVKIWISKKAVPSHSHHGCSWKQLGLHQCMKDATRQKFDFFILIWCIQWTKWISDKYEYEQILQNNTTKVAKLSKMILAHCLKTIYFLTHNYVNMRSNFLLLQAHFLQVFSSTKWSLKLLFSIM